MYISIYNYNDDLKQIQDRDGTFLPRDLFATYEKLIGLVQDGFPNPWAPSVSYPSRVFGLAASF